MTKSCTLPADHPAHKAVFTAAQLVAVVPEHVGELTWTDRSLPNASDYVDYHLVPGEYPVKFTYLDGRECPPETLGWEHAAYWVQTMVDVVELRRGGTNRLLSASSSYEHEGYGATTRTFSTYAYYASDGYILASTPDPANGNRWPYEPVLVLKVR